MGIRRAAMPTCRGDRLTAWPPDHNQTGQARPRRRADARQENKKQHLCCTGVLMLPADRRLVGTTRNGTCAARWCALVLLLAGMSAAAGCGDIEFWWWRDQPRRPIRPTPQPIRRASSSAPATAPVQAATPGESRRRRRRPVPRSPASTSSFCGAGHRPNRRRRGSRTFSSNTRRPGPWARC